MWGKIVLNKEIECLVPPNLNLFPFLSFSFVFVLRFVTNRLYAFFCIFKVRSLPDNIFLIILIHWIKTEHVLLMIMNDSWGTVYYTNDAIVNHDHL